MDTPKSRPRIEPTFVICGDVFPLTFAGCADAVVLLGEVMSDPAAPQGSGRASGRTKEMLALRFIADRMEEILDTPARENGWQKESDRGQR